MEERGIHMEQVARVKKVLENGMAEVAVERQTACGVHKCSDCSSCEKMVEMGDTVVLAHNDASAQKDDIVLLKSENAPFYTAAFMVYLVPFILFFAFYFVAVGILGGGNLPILWAVIGFGLGILSAVAWDRRAKRKNSLQFHIVEVQKQSCCG